MIYDAHFGDYIEYLTKNLDSEDFYKFLKSVKIKADEDYKSQKDSEIQKDGDIGIAQGSSTYMIYVKIPGFHKDEIDLSIEGDELVIQAESDCSLLTNDKKSIIQDLKIENINKRIKIPESYIKGEVKAFLTNGILKIYIEQNKDFTRNIEIK